MSSEKCGFLIFVLIIPSAPFHLGSELLFFYPTKSVFPMTNFLSLSVSQPQTCPSFHPVILTISPPRTCLPHPVSQYLSPSKPVHRLASGFHNNNKWHPCSANEEMGAQRGYDAFWKWDIYQETGLGLILDPLAPKVCIPSSRPLKYLWWFLDDSTFYFRLLWLRTLQTSVVNPTGHCEWLPIVRSHSTPFLFPWTG